MDRQEKIKEFIKTNGYTYTREAIVDSLIESGATEKEIQKAFKDLGVKNPKKLKGAKKLSKQNKSIVFGIILIVLITVTVYLLIPEDKNNTDNWKTATSEKYNFSFKYPPEWNEKWNPTEDDTAGATPEQIAEMENTIMVGELWDENGARTMIEWPEGVVIVILEDQNPEGLPSSEFINKGNLMSEETAAISDAEYVHYATIDGIDLYEQKNAGMPAIMFTRGNDLYTIMDGILFFGGPSKIRGRFDTIVSTLEFY